MSDAIALERLLASAKKLTDLLSQAEQNHGGLIGTDTLKAANVLRVANPQGAVMSENLTTEQVEAIRAGCEGVTPGPWEIGIAGDYPPNAALDADHTPIHSYTWGAFISVVTDIDGGGGRIGTSKQGVANLAHIARLDPQTVSSLATELLALRKRVGDERRRAIAAIHWVFNADGTVGERAMAQEAIHKINDPSFMPEGRS